MLFAAIAPYGLADSLSAVETMQHLWLICTFMPHY